MTALAFGIVALAAYRTWALIAEDELLAPARGKLSEGWQDFLGCYWCAGFWVALAWALAWWVDGRAVYVAVPFALSTLVAVVAVVVDRLEGVDCGVPHEPPEGGPGRRSPQAQV